MTDYDFIMACCRKYHFTKWNDKELRQCQEVLPSLTREELVRLYRSRWIDEKSPLRKTILQVLFEGVVGKREERIKGLPTEELVAEFRDKKSGNIALLRKEMRRRFQENRDRFVIANAFNASIKMDQQWVASQLRKEENGGGYPRSGRASYAYR